MTMELPRAYTVLPDEPTEWSDEIEELRESLIGLCVPMPEVERQLTLRLTELRDLRIAAAREKEDAETLEHERMLDLPAPEVIEPDDPRLDSVRKIEAKFPLMTWSQFRDSTSDVTAWLVEGILAQKQQAFIGAPAKYGKTWVAGDLAVSVTTGTPFLQRFVVPEAAPVIYLALEGQLAALKTRFGCLSRAHGVDPDSNALDSLHLRPRTPGINLADPSWADWIIEQVRQTGSKLLVVDVLRKAMPKMRETGDGANDVSTLVDNLAPLADLGCAVEFLHHFLKRSDATKDRGVLEMLVGSGALGGHADNLLGIGKREKEGQLIRRLMVECDGRDDATPEPFTINLEGDAHGKHGGWCYTDTLTLRAVHDEPKAKKIDKRELRSIEILTWIGEQPNRSVKPGDVRAHFDLAEDELRNLRRDYLDRFLDVDGHGPATRYTLKEGLA